MNNSSKECFVQYLMDSNCACVRSTTLDNFALDQTELSTSLNKVAKRSRHFTQHACQALYSEQSRAFGQSLMCVQKRTELSSMSQRPRWSSIKTSGYLSFATKKMQQNRLQKHFLRGGKKLEPCYPGVACATPWLRAWFEGDPPSPFTFHLCKEPKEMLDLIGFIPTTANYNGYCLVDDFWKLRT